MNATSDGWRGRRVFITGATGLLGKHLVPLLLDKGATVAALVRQPPDQAGLIPVIGEIEDFSIVERSLADFRPDTIFHLAGQAVVSSGNESPVATFRTNIEGTWNLLEAVHRKLPDVKAVIVASSARIYEANNDKVHEESAPLSGNNPYDVSKCCADLIARSYATTYRVPVCTVRAANFFGPGDLNFSRIIPGTIRTALLDERPIIRGDGRAIRDFLYVEDACSGFLALAEKMWTTALHGEAFNLSYGSGLSVSELVQHVLKILNKDHLSPIILNESQGEVAFRRLDNTKARKILGWNPRFGISEGLMKTVEWYAQRISIRQ